MRGLPLAPGEGLTLTAYTAEPGTPSHDGLKLPASLTGLGPRTGQAILVAAWYAGLTALALAFAYRGRGLGRPPGAVIITGYPAFVSALASTITQARVSPAAAAVPATVITLAGTILLARPPEPARCPAAAGRAAWWQRRSLLPGWNAGRLWTLSLALCLIIAACEAATRPQLILIGLLICGRAAHCSPPDGHRPPHPAPSPSPWAWHSASPTRYSRHSSSTRSCQPSQQSPRQPPPAQPSCNDGPPDRSGPDNRFGRWAGTGKMWPWFQPRCVMRRRWPGRRCAARAV